MNLLNVRSFADVRSFLYAALPVISAFLVTNGVVNEAEASLWAGLVTAILGPVVAAVMSQSLSKFRAAFYSVLAAGQALVVGYGLVTEDQVGMWMPIVNLVVGGVAGGVAAANTENSAR